MHFETIKHRRVTIKQMVEAEERKRAIKEYLRQLKIYEIMEKDKITIDENDEFFVIYSEDNKFIGVILMKSINEKVGYISISIPKHLELLLIL